MASLSVMLADHERKDKTYSIVFRLTIDRVSKYERTKYAVLEKQFKNGVVVKHPYADLINNAIEIRKSEILKNILDANVGKISETHEAIFSQTAKINITLDALLAERAAYMYKRGSIATHRKLSTIKEEILECWGKISLNEITPDKVEQYEIFLRSKKNGSNTIHKKISTISQLIDKEKDKGKYSGMNALKLHNVPKEPVHKDKLSWEEIKAIQELKLKGLIETVRDMFLFSFYAHGMRFESCILLEKKVINSLINYQMNKGRKHLEVAVNPTLDNIIRKYIDTEGKRLFPFIDEKPEDPELWENKKNSVNVMVNSYLKRVSILAGIEKDVTFHVARHTFADLLKKYQSEKGKSDIYLIQEALGHSDVKTTETYLGTLGNDEVNTQVNEMFAEKLLQDSSKIAS